MAGEFNPYREWLRLEGQGRPNHYELIGVERFEGDAKRIAASAERATTRVRSFKPGVNARVWAELLDEIRAARECLCDPARKAEYDARLGATAEAYAEVDGDLPMAIPLGVGGADAAVGIDMEGRIDEAAFAPPVVEPPAAKEAPRAGCGLLIVGLIGLVLLIVAVAVYVVLAT